VKKSVLFRCALSLLIALFCLSSQDNVISADEEKPAVKTPDLKKKQQTKTKNEKQPEIFIETKDYDVGKVYEGTLATHAFMVKNKGKGDLLIKRVKPG